MSKLPPLSLYIHIPWCEQKCPYCDFNSHTLAGEIPEQTYIDHLLADLSHDLCFVHGRTVKTLFIGGGTPSLLSGAALQRLLTGVRQRLSLQEDAEITLEANPGSVEAERFAAYHAAGVNRISLGVQSFQAKHLIKLGRIHNPAEAIRAAQLAKSLPLRSMNLDLMHGLSAQTPQEALDDLQQAIALDPPHLSWYQLTIEPHTLYGSRPPPLPDEDTLWDIGQQGHQLLLDHGYQQYEISAYTKGDLPCQHNLNYWRFGDYLGIGCGAHGKLTDEQGNIIRTVKTRHPRGYMQGHYRDQPLSVPLAERPFEFFMNRFRLVEPTPKQDFSRLTQLDEKVIHTPITQAIAQGYLTETPTHWQVTPRGRLFLNSLLEGFLAP